MNVGESLQGKMAFQRDKHLAKDVPTMLICVIFIDFTVYKLKTGKKNYNCEVKIRGESYT